MRWRFEHELRKNGLVAQLVEQATLNRQVVGSNPTWSTIYSLSLFF